MFSKRSICQLEVRGGLCKGFRRPYIICCFSGKEMEARRDEAAAHDPTPGLAVWRRAVQQGAT